MREDVTPYFEEGKFQKLDDPCIHGEEDNSFVDVCDFIENQFRIGNNPTVENCKSRLSVDRTINPDAISLIEVN